MGLLHKNLILAGIASVAMVGFLGSSSVSALDGFSLSDIVSNYRNQTEQLKSYLTNPFGSGCEATNPDSTISCNETSFPNLLFNGAPNNSTWGHEGKGLVFVDNNNLVEGNPQLATAKRGDTLNFSMEIETQRYNDAEMTSPVEVYAIYGLFSDGLVFDPQSIVVKVGGQVLVQDSYALEHIDDLGEASALLGDAKSVFYAQVPWSNSGNFLYDEDAKITVTYTATIAEDVPSEVWSRGAYASDSSSQDSSFLRDTEHQATALIDGNILIRRVDANGNPLAGAKYTVSGVKADQTSVEGVYSYNPEGSVTEFQATTGGQVFILGVPFGDYVVTEVETPDGHEASEKSIVKAVSFSDLKTSSYQYDRISFSGMDMGPHIQTYDDGTQGWYLLYEEAKFSYNTISEQFESNHGAWLNHTVITKDANGYHYTTAIRDDENGDKVVSGSFKYDQTHKKYMTVFNISEVYGNSMNRGSDYLVFSENRQSVVVEGYSEYGERPGDFTYDESDGCYYGDIPFSGGYRWKKLCQDGDYYRLAGAYGDSSEYSAYLSIRYDGNLNTYFMDYPMFVATIEEESPEQLTLTLAPKLNYSKKMDKYLVLFGSDGVSQVGFDRETANADVAVAEFLFKDKTDKAIPGGIVNPQTSDVIIKVLAVSVVALLPTITIRRHFSRR